MQAKFSKTVSAIRKRIRQDAQVYLPQTVLFFLKGADAPEAAAGSCVSSEQPAAPAGCGLMAELSKSQQKSRKRPAQVYLQQDVFSF